MMHTISRATAIAAACGLAAAAQGQNTWTNPAGGLFGEASNWSAGVPTASSDLLFDLAAVYTVELQQDRTAQSLTVGASDVALDLNGHTLTLAGASSLDGSSSFSPPVLPHLRIRNGDIRTPNSSFNSIQNAHFLAVEVGDGGRLLLDSNISMGVITLRLNADDAYMRTGDLLMGGEAGLEMSNGAAAEVQSLFFDESTRLLLDGTFTSLRVEGAARTGPQHRTRVENGATLEAGSLSLFGYQLFQTDLGADLMIDGAGSTVRVSGHTSITSNNTLVDLTNRGALISDTVSISNRAEVTINGLGSRLVAGSQVSLGEGRILLEDRARIEAPLVRVGFESAFNESTFFGGNGVIAGSVEAGSANQFGTSVSVTGRLEITGDLSADADGGFDLPRLNMELPERLIVGGTADLTNFTLVLGADAATTPLYRRFTLIDAGSIAGQFADVVLPSLAAMQGAVEVAGGLPVAGAPGAMQTSEYAWVVTYTGNTVEVQLVPAPGGVAIALPLGLAAMRRRR